MQIRKTFLVGAIASLMILLVPSCGASDKGPVRTFRCHLEGWSCTGKYEDDVVYAQCTDHITCCDQQKDSWAEMVWTPHVWICDCWDIKDPKAPDWAKPTIKGQTNGDGQDPLPPGQLWSAPPGYHTEGTGDSHQEIYVDACPGTNTQVPTGTTDGGVTCAEVDQPCSKNEDCCEFGNNVACVLGYCGQCKSSGDVCLADYVCCSGVCDSAACQ